MPELPETETIARDLDATLRGRTIVRVVVEKEDVLREVTARQLARRLTRATIERCWRRAKLVVLDLDSGERLVVQPRFTGALIVDEGAMSDRDRQYSTLHVVLDDGRRLHYRDIRRLGTVALMRPPRFAAYTETLGVEPLDPMFTAERLSAILRRGRQAVKKILMDQRKVAGVGNIYANESLWRARVHPARAGASLTPAETERLHEAIVGVLTESIALRGTSFRDYVDARGGKGGFVEKLAVYGRAADACTRCHATLEGTRDIDGRSTVFCARCQT